MAKSGLHRRQESIELEPDAWPRFERFIRQITKAGPQHRVSGKPKAKHARSSAQKKAPPSRV